MSDGDFANNVIWLASLILPLLLFSVGSLSRSTGRNLIHAGVAIGAGWALCVAYVIAAQAIYMSTASPSELLAFYDRDGAPRAFAAVLGWVPAALVVAIAWIVRSVLASRRRARRL